MLCYQGNNNKERALPELRNISTCEGLLPNRNDSFPPLDGIIGLLNEQVLTPIILLGYGFRTIHPLVNTKYHHMKCDIF